MTDPYAHGMPAGDFHTWIDPSRSDCPNCPCCTVRLCQRAAEKGTSCTWESSNNGDFDMAKCPCAPWKPVTAESEVKL